MRLGEPTWKIILGVFDIELDKLTQISIPKEKAVNELVEDIRKKGLLNPLEIRWTLDEEHLGQFRIFKGNQRIEALRRLNWKKASCRITVEGYKDTEIIGEILNGKKIQKRANDDEAQADEKNGRQEKNDDA